MRYDLCTAVQREKSKTRRVAVAVIASAAMLIGSAVPALADPGDQASPCGAVHGAFASENGNFGFLGELGGTPGYHNGARGQEAGATGFNNSHTDCQDAN